MAQEDENSEETQGDLIPIGFAVVVEGGEIMGATSVASHCSRVNFSWACTGEVLTTGSDLDIAAVAAVAQTGAVGDEVHDRPIPLKMSRPVLSKYLWIGPMSPFYFFFPGPN
ncbi:hypothetical protein Ancab_032141 [Ancistrocladus abbreviatus]